MNPSGQGQLGDGHRPVALTGQLHHQAQRVLGRLGEHGPTLPILDIEVQIIYLVALSPRPCLARNDGQPAWGLVADARCWPASSSSARGTWRTSTRRWSATPSPPSSPPSASPTATRCGCSARRRALYWRRGWQLFFQPRLPRREPRRSSAGGSSSSSPLNRFICRRGSRARAAHWLIMWGCLLAAAITFPLVFGWVHFETVPGRPRHVPRLRLRLPDGRRSRSTRSLGFLDLPRPGLGVVPGHRRRDAGHAAADASTTARRPCSSSARTSCR